MTDANVVSARDEFFEHAARAREFLSLNLSEADTRAYLVDPVLIILGYRAPGDIRREVPVAATKEFLDYELRAGGQAHAIVEAKALKHTVTDQHAGQCVQYASVLGVRWCLITNGVAWVLYDAYAKGPLAEKKVADVRLDGDEETTARAWSVLSLFSLESLSRSAPLTQLLIERVVADEMSRADSPAVNALRRAVKDRFGEQVSGQSVLDALRRPEAQTYRSADEVTSPDAGATGRPSKIKRGRSRKNVISGVAQLVEAGFLPADAVLECKLYGVTHAARVRDGQIELNGELYATPSAAASALRAGKATNGWTTWRHKGESLSELRAKLLEQTPAFADTNPV
jgi:hypothetical protein